MQSREAIGRGEGCRRWKRGRKLKAVAESVNEGEVKGFDGGRSNTHGKGERYANLRSHALWHVSTSRIEFFW